MLNKPHPTPLKHPRYPWGKPKEERVTLIAGWGCVDGLVMHADSQETTPDGRRVTVQKIDPRTMGNFEVVVTGSGVGELVDAFAEQLDRYMVDESTESVLEFRGIVEAQLKEFTMHEVAMYPLPKTRKHLQFIIGCSSPKTQECLLWQTRATHLQRIKDCALIGWDIPFYQHLSQRFYRPQMTISQAVIAGLYVLSVAEQTSNSVKGPVSVAIIKPTGITMESREYVDDLWDRLKKYGALLDNIFMLCSDTSIYLPQLEKALGEFKNQAMLLHKTYLAGVLCQIVTQGTASTIHPYLKVPPGITLSLLAGDLDEVLTAAEKEEIMRYIERSTTPGQLHPELTIPDQSGQPPSPE